MTVAVNVPVGWVQTLRKNHCCEPARTPDPVQVARVTGVVLLSVPATNPAPDAVHVTLEAGITVRPDRRSSEARTVSTTCAPGVARDLAVIAIGPPADGTC